MPVVHFSRINRSFQVPTFRTWKTAAFYPHLIHFKPVSAFHIVIILKRVMLSTEVATNSINLPMFVHGRTFLEPYYTCAIRVHPMNCSAFRYPHLVYQHTSYIARLCSHEAGQHVFIVGVRTIILYIQYNPIYVCHLQV